MHLVDLHVPTSYQSLELNPDLQSLELNADLQSLELNPDLQSLELNPDLQSLTATQAKGTAASDLHHCATGAGFRFLISTITNVCINCNNCTKVAPLKSPDRT